MKRSMLIAGTTALVAVSAAVAVSSVQAAPIPGATRITQTSSDPDSMSTFAAGGNAFTGLTSLGCPFVQYAFDGTATGITFTYRGWMGPIDQTTLEQQVFLKGHLTGTLQDLAGNTYTVDGNFTDRSIHVAALTSDLRFDGLGQVNYSGPTGSVVGRAEFIFVTAPPSFQVIVSSIKSCTISS